MVTSLPLRDRVAAALSRQPSLRRAVPGYKRAAVLLPLYEAPGGPHLLFTKRTETLPTHKGQISFPGGGYQDEDGDLERTALREAQEEVGLDPADVVMAGALDDAAGVVSGHLVRPYVGIVPHPYPYRPDPREIEALLHVPVAALLSGGYPEEIREDGRRVLVFAYRHDGEVIWGLTARILQQFLERVAAPLWGSSG